MIKEKWKAIKWYKDYQISNLWRVKSLNYRRTWKEKILTPWIVSKYYSRVALFKGKESRYFLVHRLVAQAFLGLDINNIKELACHKDETLINWLLDNSVNNLWIGTHLDNNRDRDNKKRHWTKYYPEEIWKIDFDYIPSDSPVIKFYKNITDYADQENISTKTASKRIKNNLVEVFEVPKGMKYYEVDKSAIVAEYINNLSK